MAIVAAAAYWTHGLSPDSPRYVNARTGETYGVRLDSSLACRTIADYDRVVGYLRAGDKAAFDRGLGMALLRGECELLAVGDSVVVTDLKDNMARVRKRGELPEFWTNPGALK